MFTYLHRDDKINIKKLSQHKWLDVMLLWREMSEGMVSKANEHKHTSNQKRFQVPGNILGSLASCLSHVIGLCGDTWDWQHFEWLWGGCFSVLFQFSFIIEPKWPTYWKNIYLCSLYYTGFLLNNNAVFKWNKPKIIIIIKKNSKVILDWDWQMLIRATIYEPVCLHTHKIWASTEHYYWDKMPHHQVTEINQFLERGVYYNTQIAKPGNIMYKRKCWINPGASHCEEPQRHYADI